MPEPDGNGDLGQIQIEDAINATSALEPFVRVARDLAADFQSYHQIQSMLLDEAGLTKHLLHIEDAQTARFEKATQKRRAAADDGVALACEVSGIISHQAMTARQQFECEFTFANATGTGEQYAESEQFHEHAMQRDGVHEAWSIIEMDINALPALDCRTIYLFNYIVIFNKYIINYNRCSFCEAEAGWD